MHREFGKQQFTRLGYMGTFIGRLEKEIQICRYKHLKVLLERTSGDRIKLDILRKNGLGSCSFGKE